MGDDKQFDSLSSPPPTYIGDMKIDTRVLDLEKKHCHVPGWRGQMIFPIDNRGLGEHHDVIQQMSTGTNKDRQLLEEVLDEVITRNKEEYVTEDGNNEELNGKEHFEGESEHADDDDLENKNKNENKVVDKSHSLDLESQQESHSETDGYGDSNEETCKQQVPDHGVTSHN